MGVRESLEAQVRTRPDAVALVSAEGSLTYGALGEAVAELADAYRRAGLAPGDRVVTLLPNGLLAVEALLAAAAAGVVACPLNPRSPAPELAYLLADAEPRLVLGAPAALEAARAVLPPGVPTWPALTLDDVRAVAAELPASARTPEAPVPPDAPWVLVYTSGTTGRPKGALRNQESDDRVGRLLAPLLGVTPADRGFVVLPLYHINSIWVVSLSLCLGATCHLYTAPRIQPGAMLDELARSQASYTMLVPTLLAFLADALEAGTHRFPALRLLMTSSAPLAPSLRDRLVAALPGVRIAELYGATELGPVTLAWHGPDHPADSVGLPLPGVRVHLLDAARRPVPPGAVGELFAEGPFLMDGYFRRPDATAAARHGQALTVGDLARQDEAGRLYLVDRLADTIITGGENVYPNEVEGVLLAHPAVALAAVVGVPDPRRGEAVAAVVVPRPGVSVTAAELLAHCRRHLAPYKCPRTIAFAEGLPLAPTGKVLRRQVRELWREGRYGAP
jgi:acyl-CoA synthetase (AMP-forming)/AMP-acid ligase II